MDDLSLGKAWPPAGDHRTRFAAIRSHTDHLVRDLTPEDQGVQSMADASPAKWHRAHTTWFFEQFVLVPNAPGYVVFDETFRFLFNSYYEAIGARHPRPMRGLLTRPSAERVSAYRAHVDAAMDRFLGDVRSAPVAGLVELGLHHEQQHQELLVTDTLHAFAQNPLRPALATTGFDPAPDPGPDCFIAIPGGVHRIGHDGTDFCFDNETPAHDVLLADFAIASHLVRNGAYQSFIADGGYDTPTLWMSDGWAAARAQDWRTPLHWFERDGVWWQMEPTGPRLLDLDAPVRHLSWYEADAFARWAGARLPTEAEWEVASRTEAMREVDTHVWQWTDSAYRPYPRFKPVAGAVGEYNGKFMVNQMVLRGGSLATPAGHARPSYRNFFHPDKRWQFSGLRLARDA